MLKKNALRLQWSADPIRLMKKFLSSVIVPVLLSSTLAVAQSECAQLTRSARTEMLTADTWRPLSATARSLASRLGIIISAEDPDLVFTGDLTDTTVQALPEWRATHPKLEFISRRRGDCRLRLA
jgi:hypothetical protein